MCNCVVICTCELPQQLTKAFNLQFCKCCGTNALHANELCPFIWTSTHTPHTTVSSLWFHVTLKNVPLLFFVCLLEIIIMSTKSKYYFYIRLNRKMTNGDVTNAWKLIKHLNFHARWTIRNAPWPIITAHIKICWISPHKSHFILSVINQKRKKLWWQIKAVICAVHWLKNRYMFLHANTAKP